MTSLGDATRAAGVAVDAVHPPLKRDDAGGSTFGPAFARLANAPPDFTDIGLGSNAWGIGREPSEQGRGALLANPHFPHTGPRRPYQVHMTVPGYLDVNGAGLIGTALPLIGFDRDLAWSHTVSTARRFTLCELTLAEGDDLVYVKDGERRPIERETSPSTRTIR